MTKITTDANRRTQIISWVIAILVGGGLIFLLRQLPSPDLYRQKMNLQAKKSQPVREVNRQIKEEQAQRPLPENYAQQLVKQSEILIKQELQERLNKFQEMAQNMRNSRDEYLNRVEKRRLPSTAPNDANNTSAARKIPQAGIKSLGANSSVQDIYNVLKEYELEIQRNNLAVTAAKRSLSQGLSFPDVYASLTMGASLMPAFDELIRSQANGAAWERSEMSNASSGLKINSTADLNNYRGLLGQATRQAGLANVRLESLFGVPKAGRSKTPEGFGNIGNNSGNGGMATNYTGTSSKTPMGRYTPRLNEDMVKAQALPGRRFSKNSDRKGWLYVNTWYMIGPWENHGRDDFAFVHPPEIAVDFDAVYTDGQTGEGTVETDSHPIRMYGDKVWLDGKLRWKFMQSESMHNTMPVTTGHSTYYAYTELYFDEAAEMRVAIGTDDSGKLWINGKTVWQDTGTSWYHIDEHIAPFRFQQGWNRVLVRLENGGGGPAGFSFLIMP
jgi:hypothetical protein